MKASEFIRRLKDVATNYKTLYVMGCFGAPMNSANKARYTKNHEYNMRADRVSMIKAASANTFGFDCVCLIKGILWGWSGRADRTYGGATYASNGVPDIGADTMITRCSGVSANFEKILPGEAVWVEGHIGVYVGDGLVVECTPAWKNCVQFTTMRNAHTRSGYNARTWAKHGKLPWIDYSDVTATVPTPGTKPVTGTPSRGTAADEKRIWNFFKSKGLNSYAIAGIMGNLNAESALRSNNLQDSYQKRLGYNDATYTAAVDNGRYNNFVHDSAGYGLAQWTYYTRKQALLSWAKKHNKSIGDLQMQLDFLWEELSINFGAVLKTLKKATSVQVASDVFMCKFENPADQSTSAKNRRAALGVQYYNKYAGATATPKPTSTPTPEAPRKTVDALAREVIQGKWGNGLDRKKRLTAAGYSYSAVQHRVEAILSGKKSKSVDELAREVIQGKWGSGAERKRRLTAAGYNYSAVQKRVNELMK